VASRAKHIVRKILPNVRGRLLIAGSHQRSIEWPAVERNSKAQWFLKDQCGVGGMTAEISWRWGRSPWPL
jgi:hypothetical protein